MKVLWLSDFKPLPCQMDALKRKFNITDGDVVHDTTHLESAEDIITHFRRSGCGEFIFFRSWSMLSRLCELGVRPYFPVMERVMARNREQADLAVGRAPNQRFFRFVKFARVCDVTMNFVEGDEFE